MESPLDGIKILDLTIWQNGPWATVMLSDMGADVIKIEDAIQGDPGRAIRIGGRSEKGPHTYFQTMNRNKRSVTLNLKTGQGRTLFLEMSKGADVITQNFRKGVVEKLGIGYEDVRKVNKEIIYASVTGFGPEGPDAHDGVYDILGQARGGFLSLMSASSPDIQYPGHGGLADQMGAIILAYAVLLGVVARERHGVGQHIHTSQLSGQLLLQALAVNGYLLNGTMPKPRYREKQANPLFNIYQCADEKWIAIGCIQGDRYWPSFCRVLAIDELINDVRFSSMEGRRDNAEELIRVLDDVFKTRARDEWLKPLKDGDVLCSPVQAYDDLPHDPQIIANDYLTELEHPDFGSMKEVGVTIGLSQTPGRARRRAPEFGEHTEEVLQEHGYSWEQISQFRDEGVV